MPTESLDRVIWRLLEPCLGQGTPCPRETHLIPALEWCEGNSVLGRMDEPAVAERNRGMVDLCGFRLGSACAEEEDVAGNEVRCGDPLRLRDLAAHLHRGPSFQRLRELRRARVRMELVDLPDEAGAVEAAARLDAERRLGARA